jgi:uncharacterized protein (TIGR00369 family)
MSVPRARTGDGWGEPRTKQVTWYDPMITANAGVSVPGRELLQALVDGELPPPPIADVFGARLHSVGEGQVVFRCTPDESSYNPGGIVHGGLLCMLLDSACGCSVQSLLPAGAGISTIEIKVSFLSALRADGGELEVRGKALRVGRQVAFAEADAVGADGKLVGHATSSIAVIRR